MAYPTNYRTAIARAKRILLRAGFTWSVTSGRYYAYNSQQTTTKGIRVTRVGCSRQIALNAWGYTYEPREVPRALEAKALATLREAGMPFDDRGWLECES